MPETAENLLKNSPLLVIPCGGLYGRENDSLLKIVLGEYVRMGGTVLVFAQQYDSHIDNVMPVPEGESLKTYGWRQDSSCLRNSVYFESVHPALSSSTNSIKNSNAVSR